MPKLWQGSYFPDWLLERKRAEAALASVVATSYLLGVSARRMAKLVAALGVTGLSESRVSAMAADLDEQVGGVPQPPAGPCAFVAVDAPAVRWRERPSLLAGRFRSAARQGR